jgi:hypothetical protein
MFKPPVLVLLGTVTGLLPYFIFAILALPVDAGYFTSVKSVSPCFPGDGLPGQRYHGYYQEVVRAGNPGFILIPCAHSCTSAYMAVRIGIGMVKCIGVHLWDVPSNRPSVR